MLTWEKSDGFAHKVSKQNHLMNILNFNFLWLFAFNILTISISGHKHCLSILSILILINAYHYCIKIACNQYLLKISHGSFHTYAPLVIIQWWWSTSFLTLHLKSVITHHQELLFRSVSYQYLVMCFPFCTCFIAVLRVLYNLSPCIAFRWSFFFKDFHEGNDNVY